MEIFPFPLWPPCGGRVRVIDARLKTSGPIFPLLPRIFAREKVPIAGELAQPAQAWLRGRMRAGAPSAPVLQQSRCCPTARFAPGPHPALRATFSYAARGRRGKLRFAALNLAPMRVRGGGREVLNRLHVMC